MSNKSRKELGFIDFIAFIIAVLLGDEEVIKLQFSQLSQQSHIDMNYYDYETINEEPYMW